MTLFEFLSAMIEIPTVTGFERDHAQELGRLCTDYADGFFDGFTVLPSGSLLWERRCGRENAKKLVLDAHIDTVGFAVSEHCGNGFVKVVPLGGIDPYILPSAPVYLYTKDAKLYGVFSSIPPHLASKDAPAEPTVKDLYVDTGLAEEELMRLAPIGTPIGFAEPPRRMQNDRITSHSLDDKACVAMLFHACRRLAQAGEYPTQTDVYLQLSVGEERSGLGARTLAYTSCGETALSNADAALVTDVNFARMPGVKEYESLVIGKGAGISYSATTSRDFTDFVRATAEENGLPLQTVVEMRSTGTNAGMLHRQGIPCAVLSLPESNMHTYSECVSLCDMETAATLVGKVIGSFHTASVGEVRFK